MYIIEDYEEGVQLLDFIISQKQARQGGKEDYMIADLMSQFIDRSGMSKDVELESQEYQKSVNSKRKLNEEYVNLIICLTLSIPYSYRYKTGLVCEQSNVLVDLAIYTPTHQVAILVVDTNSLIADTDGRTYFPNAFLLKLTALTKHWKVYCINLSQWSKLYQTRAKQEEFIKLILH